MAGKRTAKKAAAKREDTLGDFPLPSGHYFHPPVVSPRAHTGGWDGTEADAVRRVQRVLGVDESGFYDDDTALAVQAWKQRKGLDPSAVVDEETWDALRNA